MERKFNLTEQQVLDQGEKLEKLLTLFPTRKEKLSRLYESLGERVLLAPASTKPSIHNAFPGGYLEHVIRVVVNVTQIYDDYVDSGMDVNGFTKEELQFVALHHDLGKLGFPGDGNEYYIPVTDNWFIEKKGQYYQVNTDIPFMTVPDAGLFLLQRFGIPLSFNEWHGIKIHDGPYAEENKSYFNNWAINSKFPTSLPYMIMEADVRAMRYEFLREIPSKNYGF